MKTLHRNTITRDYLISLVGNTIFSCTWIKKTNGEIRTGTFIRGAKKFKSETASKPTKAQLTADARHNNLKATELNPITEEPISSWPRTIAVSNILSIKARGLYLRRESLEEDFVKG